MGIYSSIVNSSDKLGVDFIGCLQTKDLDPAMDLYWIAPDGSLFKVMEPVDGSFAGHGTVRPAFYDGQINVVGLRKGKFVNRAACFCHGKLDSSR